VTRRTAASRFPARGRPGDATIRRISTPVIIAASQQDSRQEGRASTAAAIRAGRYTGGATSDSDPRVSLQVRHRFARSRHCPP
jgi:hypothetical protein